MVTGRGALGALVCEDDPVVGAALVDTINGLYGFEVLATLTSGEQTVAAAAATKPDLVVVDLALAGDPGLRIVARLIEVAPASQVVVVVPSTFASLRGAAMRAGAMALIELSDLRPLRGCLEQLHARVHADAPCRCCPAPSLPSAGPGAAQPACRVAIHPSGVVRPDPNRPQGSSTGQG